MKPPIVIRNKPRSAPPTITGTVLKREISSKPSTAVATLDDMKQHISIFEKEIRDINHSLDSGMNMEGATYLIAQNLLKVIMQSVPNYEEKLKDGTGRDVYAFAALTDTTLKLTNELRTLQDRSAMSKQIMDKVIKPRLETMARQIVANINKGTMTLDKREDVVALNTLESVKVDAIDFIGKLFTEIGNELQIYFGGNDGSFRENINVE